MEKKDEWVNGDGMKNYLWVAFYEQVADALLQYKDNRGELVEKIHSIYKGTALQDEDKEGNKIALEDICPFTVMALFNRQITEENRVTLAKDLARFLGVQAEAPNSFVGIPVVNNQKTWFFSFLKTRLAGEIDSLWDMFSAAIDYANTRSEEDEMVFKDLYNKVRKQNGVKWNLTMGFYWLRPLSFPTLDQKSREYIKSNLGLTVPTICDADSYISILNSLEEKFKDNACPVHSFPELSMMAEKNSKKPDENINKGMLTTENLTPQLNQILYGPPGTGKTFNTVRKAVEICDGKTYKNYEEAKERYKELKELGRIDFVTFHQSYGYEEFIEGIRAETLKGNDGESTISYDVKPGVFRNICDAASVKVSSTTSTEIDVSQKEVWKMSLGNTQSGEDYIFQDCIENDYVLLGYGDDIDFSDCRDRKDIKEKLASKLNKEIDNQDYTLTSVDMFKHQISQGDLIIISDGNHKFRAIAEVVGDYEFLANGNFCQMRKVKWLKSFAPSLPKERLFDKALSQMTLYKLREPTLNKGRLSELLNSEEITDPNDKPYVLIIDEINRGNMSKIFGELITLIEDDKRIGAKNEMKVRLPVSGEEFGVPKNLHIIGTMNTADRSIAMMDTALRRRFEFEEMMPNPCLLHVNDLESSSKHVSPEDWEEMGNWALNATEGDWAWNKDHSDEDLIVNNVNLRRMLHAMNQRIEVLYDREHTIGHAFFMGLKKEENRKDISYLKGIFENKVIPLLAEYFFEDWEKVRMVLGDNKKKDLVHQFIIEKANVDYGTLFGPSVSDVFTDERKVYERNSEALKHAESYLGIYSEGF